MSDNKLFMKNVRILFFAATMFLLLWFPFNMIYHTQRIISNGTPYRFYLQPIDPYDVFRGSYVSLNYTIPLISISDSVYTYQDVYVTIGEGTDGFAYFKNAYLQPPKEKDYIKAKVQFFTNGQVQIDAPENIRYYYLNEKTAPEVESVMNRAIQADSMQNRAHVQIRVRKGEAVVEELYINDVAVKDYLKNQ